MANPLPVVIDTDVGADPDDALALALASSELDVLGVTVVSGDLDLRARMAARLLGMAGRADIPVIRGPARPVYPAGGPNMLGTEGQGLLDLPYNGPEARILDVPAPEWLARQASILPYHLAAIGPLSNVAAALEHDPGFANRLLGLTIMGGVFDPRALSTRWQRAIDEGGPAVWPDYNTMSDPTAALAVARSGAPLTWVTVETTLRAPLRRSSLARLAAERPLFLALRRMIELWAERWLRGTLPEGELGSTAPDDTVGFLHDPLTISTLLPELGRWLRLDNAVLSYRIENGLFRLGPDHAGTKAMVSVAVDGPAFEAVCIERIAGIAAS